MRCDDSIALTLNVDLSTSATNDRNPSRRVPINSSSKDLQISAATARIALLHVVIACRLSTARGRSRRDEGHGGIGERAQKENGKHGKAGRMAKEGGPVAGLTSQTVYFVC